MREESFPISNETVSKFIEVNKNSWNETDKCEGSYIFVNLSMVRMQVAWVIPKLITARGIADKIGAKVIALTWDQNETLSSLFLSFGIQHVALNEICRKSPLCCLKAGLKTMGLYIKGADIETLLKEKYGDYCIGTDIYEDTLRTSSLSTAKNCRNKTVLKKYFHILWTVRSIEKYLVKRPASYAIMDDLAYHEGAFIKLYTMKKAKVYSVSNVSYFKIEFDEEKNIRRLPNIKHEKVANLLKNCPSDIVERADKYLEDRFAGKNGRDIDRQAFAGKVCLDREATIERLKLNPGKKNVVIMAHTFTDAIYNYGHYYFRDYYDWLDKTLAIAKNVSDVNWILKPHPTRHAYNESIDSIESMFERHKNKNMYYMDDGISAETLKDVADVIITIGGNAGGEFACVGIPSVIVGKPYYSGFDYTIEPQSYEEYKECLENISAVKRLTREQTETAKKVFYTYNNMPKEKSLEAEYDFYNELNKKYREMSEKLSVKYFASNEGTSTYNSEILEWITQYFKTHDVKKISYYVEGQKIAEEEKSK